MIVERSDGKIVHRGTTPTTVTLLAKKGYMESEEYTVKIMEDGKVVGRSTVRSHIDGWYWVNLLLGGLIGMLVVDPLTGSMWSLDTELTVNKDNLTDTTSRRVMITTLGSIPESQRRNLIRLTDRAGSETPWLVSPVYWLGTENLLLEKCRTGSRHEAEEDSKRIKIDMLESRATVTVIEE